MKDKLIDINATPEHSKKTPFGQMLCELAEEQPDFQPFHYCIIALNHYDEASFTCSSLSDRFDTLLDLKCYIAELEKLKSEALQHLINLELMGELNFQNDKDD